MTAVIPGCEANPESIAQHVPWPNGFQVRDFVAPWNDSNE